MQHGSTVSLPAAHPPDGQQEAGAAGLDRQPVVSHAESVSPSLNLTTDRQNAQAKQYHRIKIWLSLASTALFFAVTLVVVLTGLSVAVENYVRQFTTNDYVALLLFAALLGLMETVVAFPLKYYSGFHIEHRFRLSNQTFGQWLWEGFKGALVGMVIGTPILLAFYYCLKVAGELWWLPVGGVLFVVSVVLARLAPTFIFPLFYRFKPLEDGEMKQRILKLCERVGMAVEGVFVFNLSKNTKKANAAFTGIGKSKRVILGDTLVANFTDEEVETVVAHELGHFKLKHIWVMMIVGTVSTFLGLFLTAQLYHMSLVWFGFTSIDQLAALPLLSLWLGLYSLVTTPISNAISRAHERQADRYAVELTSNAQAFTNALQKLAKVNLADPSPHPVIEFMFHSHPSIEKRVRFVQEVGRKLG
ncbi:MAG TPA: M48 family metallopeptidase [Bacteroidota bacterium]|nr:M48 family metallopeptidase [Bacteroidota bacterium]